MQRLKRTPFEVEGNGLKQTDWCHYVLGRDRRR